MNKNLSKDPQLIKDYILAEQMSKMVSYQQIDLNVLNKISEFVKKHDIQYFTIDQDEYQLIFNVFRYEFQSEIDQRIGIELEVIKDDKRKKEKEYKDALNIVQKYEKEFPNLS